MQDKLIKIAVRAGNSAVLHPYQKAILELMYSTSFSIATLS